MYVGLVRWKNSIASCANFVERYFKLAFSFEVTLKEVIQIFPIEIFCLIKYH